MVPTHARQPLVHFWTFVVVARLSEYKCDAAYTMGAGLQCCKACTQLAALAFRASAPVTKPAAANCSNKRAIWRFLMPPTAAWPGTNGAQRGSLRHFASKGLRVRVPLAPPLVGGASCQAMAAGVLGPPVVYGLAGMC